MLGFTAGTMSGSLQLLLVNTGQVVWAYDQNDSLEDLSACPNGIKHEAFTLDVCCACCSDEFQLYATIPDESAAVKHDADMVSGSIPCSAQFKHIRHCS